MGELGREIDAGIEELLAQYAEFIKAGNPNLAASVLALNDPRFGQYEEYEPRLLDASATKVHLRHLIAERPLRVRFDEVRAAPIADGVCVVTGLRLLQGGPGGLLGEQVSRFTLVVVRQFSGKWRILHGHFTPVLT